MANASSTASLRVVRLSPDTRPDFYKLHSQTYRDGWCQCVAWWTPTWEGWSSRTPEQNRTLRMELFAEGVDDGYLAYDGDVPVGWCQAWRRDAFPKLRGQFSLPHDSKAWMIGCFFIARTHRKRGVAKAMLTHIVGDLKTRGATSVDAFPKRQADDDDELWNGPESMFVNAGFEVIKNDPARPLLRLSF
jgi:GNAT superfamily N-acetyltransferase